MRVELKTNIQPKTNIACLLWASIFYSILCPQQQVANATAAAVERSCFIVWILDLELAAVGLCYGQSAYISWVLLFG